MTKKKKKKQALPQTKKSRAQYTCPTELKEIIAKVRLVPTNVEMKDLFIVRDRLESEKRWKQSLFPNKNEPEVDLYKEALKECLQNLPDDFQTYIKSYEQKLKDIALNEFGRDDDIEYALMGVYSGFYTRWNSVKTFAERMKRERNGEVVSWESQSFYISAEISRDNNGTEYLTGFAGLIGKFKSDRLRICESCSRIFWAKRIDSKTCSAKCLNVFSVSNSRRPVEKKLKKLQTEFASENTKLENLKSRLSPENKLIAEQEERMKKLNEKIKNMEAAKNGTL
jgi:hypothetical protein